MDRFAFDDLYVRRLKEHDPVIERHFVDYFSPLLLPRLHRQLPAQDVDDARQDVFLRALAKLGDLRESCKLGAFVWGICGMVVLERHGKVSRTDPLDDRILQLIDDWDTEQELLRKEEAETVRQVLDDMGDSRDGQILREIFLHDEDRDEVAGRFHLSPENFRVVLHRALQKFKAALLRKRKRKIF